MQWGPCGVRVGETKDRGALSIVEPKPAQVSGTVSHVAVHGFYPLSLSVISNILGCFRSYSTNLRAVRRALRNPRPRPNSFTGHLAWQRGGATAGRFLSSGSATAVLARLMTTSMSAVAGLPNTSLDAGVRDAASPGGSIVLPSPVASAEDDRSYRVIRLSNQLEVVLCSDPTTEKVGSLSVFGFVLNVLACESSPLNVMGCLSSPTQYLLLFVRFVALIN